jgi:hypothetical protein
MRPFDDLDGLAASRMPAKPSTERPVGATQAPKAIDGTRSDKREDERRRADQQAQAEQAEAAGQGGGAQYTGGKADDKDARDKQMEAGLAAKEGDDGMDELARARQAAAQEIDARNAQAAMDQRSRAGLGGLGLSGAASAAEGDLARQQARTKILTMQEFDQAAADQNFTEIQRRAALDDLEDAADIDYDGDGMVAGEPVGGTIGDGDPENDKKPEKPKPKPIPTNGDLNGDGVISPDERKAAQARNKKESDLQDRAAGGLGAGVPMEGKANADGTVTNTSTKKTYNTATLEEALDGGWIYGGASFTADGKTYRVYTDSKGKKHAVEG